MKDEEQKEEVPAERHSQLMGLLELRSTQNKGENLTDEDDQRKAMQAKILGTKTQAMAEETVKESCQSPIEIPEDLCLESEMEMMLQGKKSVKRTHSRRSSSHNDDIDTEFFEQLLCPETMKHIQPGRESADEEQKASLTSLQELIKSRSPKRD